MLDPEQIIFGNSYPMVDISKKSQNHRFVVYILRHRDWT
jgi:hypothetical protein